MTNFIKRAAAKLDELKENLVILKYTRKINDSDLLLPEWFTLAADYKAAEDEQTIIKALISLRNAIIFQRRVVFCLSRDCTRELINQDKNWKQSPGLKNENYKLIISMAIQLNMIKEVQKGRSKQLSVYEVIDNELLQILKINVDAQTQEVFDFVNRKSKGTETGTAKGDTEVRSKKLVDSKIDGRDNNITNKQATLNASPLPDKSKVNSEGSGNTNPSPVPSPPSLLQKPKLKKPPVDTSNITSNATWKQTPEYIKQLAEAKAKQN